jgi:hypothetical protein
MDINGKTITIKKYILLFVLLINLINGTIAQNLTKNQMMDDLMFLESHIKCYYSALALLEKRTGISIDSEFNILKQKINDIQSIEEFTEIVRQGMLILNDSHTRIASKSQIKWFVPNSYLSSVSNVVLNDTLEADYYLNMFTSDVKCNILTKYINGKYYNLLPFEYNDSIFNAGEEITAVDKIPIHDFINNNRTKQN